MQQNILDLLSGADFVKILEPSKKALDDFAELLSEDTTELLSNDNVTKMLSSLMNNIATKEPDTETEPKPTAQDKMSHTSFIEQLLNTRSSQRPQDLSSLFTGSQPSLDDPSVEDLVRELMFSSIGEHLSTPTPKIQPPKLPEVKCPTVCPMKRSCEEPIKLVPRPDRQKKEETITISKKVFKELLDDEDEVSDDLLNALNKHLFADKADDNSKNVLSLMMKDDAKDVARRLFSS